MKNNNKKEAAAPGATLPKEMSREQLIEALKKDMGIIGHLVSFVLYNEIVQGAIADEMLKIQANLHNKKELMPEDFTKEPV